jgi:nucleolin
LFDVLRLIAISRRLDSPLVGKMEQEQVYSTTSLFVGDLAQFCSENDLQELFSQHGELTEVRIMRNNTTKKPLCYGFVSFAANEGAKAALEALNGMPFQGRNLRYRSYQGNETSIL